ncbi:MAG: AAA family ATPase [Dethiobacteraceae bacterium]
MQESITRVAVLDDSFVSRNYRGSEIEYLVIPAVSLREVIDALQEHEVDLVLVAEDYGDPYKVGRSISEAIDVPVLLTVNEYDVLKYRQALAYGLINLVSVPVTQAKLKQALGHAAAAEEPQTIDHHFYIEDTEPEVPRVKLKGMVKKKTVEIPPPNPIIKKRKPLLKHHIDGRVGKAVVFYNTKGGVGKTCLAVNTAAQVTKLYPSKKIALIDFDLDFGDIANFLGIEPKVTAMSWLYIPKDNLREAQLENYLIKHELGFWVLPAPIPPIDEGIFSYKVAEKILSTLKGYFDIVIVDLGSTLRDVSIVSLDNADEIYLVSTPDAPSLRNAYDLVTIFEGLNIKKQQVKLILNKIYSPVDQEDIKNIIPYELVLEIPEISAVRTLYDTYRLALTNKRFRSYINELARIIAGKTELTARGVKNGTASQKTG